VSCGPDHALRDRGSIIVLTYLLFCISRPEVLLMVSGTSYLSVYRVASALLYFNHALLVTCKRPAILVLDFGYKGSALLYFCLVDPICYD
jgi:hypothetical protein